MNKCIFLCTAAVTPIAIACAAPARAQTDVPPQSTSAPSSAAVSIAARPSGATGSQSSSAVPATTAPNDSNQLPEVIVTAQKRSERLRDVPISVTAVSGAQLANLGITQPRDLVKVVPGLTYTESSFGAPVYTLRGVGLEVSAIGVAPAVSVYSNQVPLPYSRMAEGASLDVERVEVLKGPQGTLFGQNATGGAINYIPAAPTREPTAGASFTYGRFNELDGTGYVSGSLSDTVRARLSVDTEHRDGWQYNYVTPPPSTTENAVAENRNGVRDFTDARLLVDWDASNSLKFELNVNGWVDHSDTEAKQKIAYSADSPGGRQGAPGYPDLQAQLMAYPNAPNDARAAGFDVPDQLRRDDNFFQTSVRADWKISPTTTFTSITAFSQLNVFEPSDNDATYLPEHYAAETGDVRSYFQEARLAGTALAGRLNWLVGGNYSNDQIHDEQLFHVVGTNTEVGPIVFDSGTILQDQRITSYAGFGNLEYKLLDNLTLQGGLRYTKRDDKFSGCLLDNGAPDSVAPAAAFLSFLATGNMITIPPGGCVTLNAATFLPEEVDRDLNENNLSYRTGVSWKVTPDALLYANVTRGYKGGAFEAYPYVISSEVTAAPQEQVISYEVGSKVVVLDHRVEITDALFYSDYKDKQEVGHANIPPFGTLPALLSIPKSRILGAELEVAARPVEGLTVRAAGSYINSKVLSDYTITSALATAVLTDIRGSAFPNTPKLQLDSRADYERPVSASMDAVIGADVNYQSHTIGDFAGGPLFNIPSYAVVDLRGGVQAPGGRWRVELWGKNIANKFYTTGIQHQNDIVTREAGLPVSYGVTVSGKV